MAEQRTLRIFFVDDDETYLKVLKHHAGQITDFKIDAITYTSGQECLDNLHLNPDMIFLDYFLDEETMTGFEALKKIKEQEPNIPVVMLSGQGKFGTAAETILHGAYNYIVKDETSFERVDHYIKEIAKGANKES